MSATTIRGKGQLTIPAHIREAYCLETGDPIEVEVVPEGILLRPKKVIDATQAWFWTRAWQTRVAKSVEEIEAGAGERFDTSEEFLTTLAE